MAGACEASGHNVGGTQRNSWIVWFGQKQPRGARLSAGVEGRRYSGGYSGPSIRTGSTATPGTPSSEVPPTVKIGKPDASGCV